MALHVKSNVGGVGIAVILLILARAFLHKRGALSHPLKLGVEFWASLLNLDGDQVWPYVQRLLAQPPRAPRTIQGRGAQAGRGDTAWPTNELSGCRSRM